MPIGFDEGATLSSDRLYRYRLWRSWGSREHRVVFVMLNPSTADESKDDPTIRKCVGFAQRWGFGAVDVVNLFAWRSTSPRGLLVSSDPIGPDNDEALRAAMSDATRIIWAWGKHTPRVAALACRRAADGCLTRTRGTPVFTLGRNADGSPPHPLMLPYDRRLEPVIL